MTFWKHNMGTKLNSKLFGNGLNMDEQQRLLLWCRCIRLSLFALCWHTWTLMNSSWPDDDLPLIGGTDTWLILRPRTIRWFFLSCFNTHTPKKNNKYGIKRGNPNFCATVLKQRWTTNPRCAPESTRHTTLCVTRKSCSEQIFTVFKWLPSSQSLLPHATNPSSYSPVKAEEKRLCNKNIKRQSMV